MKSIKLALFTGSLIVALMISSERPLNAQGTDQLISHEKITPVQAGTEHLVNGVLTISLNDRTLKQLKEKDAAYFVSLTPIGDCGELKLKEKTGNQFTVQESSPVSSTGAFDYIVMVQSTVYTGIKPQTVNK